MCAPCFLSATSTPSPSEAPPSTERNRPGSGALIPTAPRKSRLEDSSASAGRRTIGRKLQPAQASHHREAATHGHGLAREYPRFLSKDACTERTQVDRLNGLGL